MDLKLGLWLDGVVVELFGIPGLPRRPCAGRPDNIARAVFRPDLGEQRRTLGRRRLGDRVRRARQEVGRQPPIRVVITVRPLEGTAAVAALLGLQVLEKLLDGQARVLQDRPERALRHVVPGMHRDRVVERPSGCRRR